MINYNNNLILIKGEDKTENIEKWEYVKGSYIITFRGGKIFKYNYQNVVFCKDPQVIYIKDTIVLKCGIPLNNVHKVLIFGSHTKIIYKNNYRETVESSNLKYINSVDKLPECSNCLEYLRQVAIIIGLRGKDGSNILANRYEKLNIIREDTALAAFLKGKLNKCKQGSGKYIVYPFGFNLSQKNAVEHAINSSMSIIEGPPGTGKTQTILNIIANAIINNETVAVVSSNNSATQNIIDKLNRYKLDFIAAYLGSTDNKKDFIEYQSYKLPEFDDWDLEDERYNEINEELINMSLELDKMLSKKNQLSMLKQERDNLEVEHRNYLKYFKETYSDKNMKNISLKMQSHKIMKLLIYLENRNTVKNTFFDYICYLFKFRIINMSLLRENLETQIALCQKAFYETKLKEVEAQISEIEKELESYDFDNAMNQYTYKSVLILKSCIAKKYGNRRERKIYTIDDLWKNSYEFIKDYPVVLSTTYSLSSSLSSEFVYDYIIVDEASQVDLATGALALSCAKKAVIVGDLKQLPNVVTENIKEDTDRVFERFKLNEAYRYSSNSLLSSISSIFKMAPHTLLREHYRCNPRIIQFCNQKFYNGELIILTEDNFDKHPLKVYKTAKGNHKRDNTNIRQVDVIQNEVIPEENLDVNKDSIGIVTPYRNQCKYLQDVFKDTKVKADTVDKFQGQECETVIISTVDDEISTFADDPNRLNVAISRAINQLIVVTDGNEVKGNSNLKDLIDYIEYNNCEIKDSKVYSIFDYLYKSYSEARIQYLKDKKKVSDYDSENLMNSLIEEILSSNEKLEEYAVAVHVPIRMIIRDFEKLDDKAIRYVMAPGTHLDFVIYSKVTKNAILVIEVDGYEFHKEGTKQYERDKLKNLILERYEIPYLRFSTNGSGEKDIIINRLNELVS